LRGHVFDEVWNGQEDKVSEDSRQLMKFFGMYQQQDRDHKGIWTFMVRIATPAGLLTADQYLVLDDLANELGQGHWRLTSRQAVQIHGVAKNHLVPLVRRIAHWGMTSFGGCGDVVRNIVTCPWPDSDGPRRGIRTMAVALSRQFKPRSQAYCEIFVRGQKVFEMVEDEPIYRDAYLPRKFKVGLTVEHDNCVDIYSQDVGLVFHPHDQLWTVLAGGGLGQSQGVSKTHAVLAKPLGRVATDDVPRVVEAIVTLQRDFGNRDDRRYARLKYLVEAWGLDRFRERVAERAKITWLPVRPLKWSPQSDHLDEDDPAVLGVWLPQGRIADTQDAQWASGLREVVRRYRPSVHITPQHHLLLGGLDRMRQNAIKALLADYGIVDVKMVSPFHRYAMACPALPTCSLALAEAERVVEQVVTRLYACWQAAGLSDADLRIRMTGCSNNCARPFLAEIGIVGAAPGKYHVFVGGSADGTRLNRLLFERVLLHEIPDRLYPFFCRYRQTRAAGERFGDWCARQGIGQPPRHAGEQAVHPQ
jgi:sulfite reductase (ferredoxin)